MNIGLAGMKRLMAVGAAMMALASVSAAAESPPVKEEPVKQEAAAPDPPYQAKLERLAEVLGSVHFLRRLCGDQSAVWRDAMAELITNEAPPAERKARLTASFNHGYRSFEGVYTRCTDAAGQALSNFMAEGESLTHDIATRYGN